MAGRGIAGPGSTASWDPAGSRVNCGSTGRTVSLDFGGWAYLVWTAALERILALESAAGVGSAAIDVVAFDKATLAMG